jgi:hypothetical protein
MPGNTYWALGEKMGEAWSIGKAMIKTPDGSGER